MESGPATVPDVLRLAADPLRWRLLVQLARSDCRVRELTAAVDEPQSLVSYHLRLLRSAGLVTATRSTHDGRETYYHLDLARCAEALAAAGGGLHPWLAHASGPRAPAAPSRPRNLSVLFICTGNSARSPLAESMLRARTGGGWTVASAGSHPKAQFHPLAAKVLRDGYGLRLSGARPRDWRTLADDRFDVVISLCDKAREAWTQSSPNPPWAHWSIPDPAAVDGVRAFQATAEDIDNRVGHLVAALAATSR